MLNGILIRSESRPMIPKKIREIMMIFPLTDPGYIVNQCKSSGRYYNQNHARLSDDDQSDNLSFSFW